MIKTVQQQHLDRLVNENFAFLADIPDKKGFGYEKDGLMYEAVTFKNSGRDAMSAISKHLQLIKDRHLVLGISAVRVSPEIIYSEQDNLYKIYSRLFFNSK